ncbi:DUF1659 domain-containing protein [Clostridium oryzae]|uniref:DUF1659 domain-containing protein n=1 Tax=Clostridium oryzae TaxID=1450648 RepID=A0A1V4IYP6_9CLOT|nr:DUF1659 domain-containing protein [Clostridium oryzae]OPJ64894.1 hypothetical protein CLORY_04030 [Clostridium oryzae]
MAVSKVLDTTTLSIEVENGTDKNGKKIYRKKTFSAVKVNADAEKIYAVAKAISAVLNAGTGDFYLNEASKLTNA